MAYILLTLLRYLFYSTLFLMFAELQHKKHFRQFFAQKLFFYTLCICRNCFRFWVGYMARSCRLGLRFRWFVVEWALLRKITKKMHVVLKQGHNSGSPWWAVQLVCWSYPSWINDLSVSFQSREPFFLHRFRLRRFPPYWLLSLWRSLLQEKFHWPPSSDEQFVSRRLSMHLFLASILLLP